MARTLLAEQLDEIIDRVIPDDTLAQAAKMQLHQLVEQKQTVAAPGDYDVDDMFDNMPV